MQLRWLFFLIEVELIHNFVLISAVQLSDSVVRIYLFHIFQVTFSEGKELMFHSLSWVVGSYALFLLCLLPYFLLNFFKKQKKKQVPCDTSEA